MEQTIEQKLAPIQVRIEQRARKELLKDLWDAYQKEVSVANTLNGNGCEIYDCQLEMVVKWSGNNSWYETVNKFSETAFNQLLPLYIRRVTDEILQKLSDIDYFVNTPKHEQDF